MAHNAWLMLTFAAAVLAACSPPYEEDPQQLSGDRGPAFKSYITEGRTIHYAEVGSGNGSPIIFLHGTPGSWSAFGSYLADEELASALHMVAVDRPGFGRSDHGDLLVSLAHQAEVLEPLVNRLSEECRVVLVGHSLGAPLAVRMAMDYPEKIAALVLVAPSLDPDLEQPRWYNSLAENRLISKMLPAELVLANREVMALPGELSEMVPRWKELDLPVSVIQGEKDKLVDPGNAEFAEKMVVRRLRVIRLEEAGHFVLWKQPELIKGEILHLYENRLPEDQCRSSG